MRHTTSKMCRRAGHSKWKARKLCRAFDARKLVCYGVIEGYCYGPDEPEETSDDTNVIAVSTGHIPRVEDRAKDRVKRQGPVDSQFKHLQPSDNRYSFRHDEF